MHLLKKCTVTQSVGVWGKVYKIKICNCVVLVCKCTFTEKFHYTQMDIILVLIFQFVRRFPWPLTVFFDIKIIYAVFKALIFVTLVIF